MNKKIKTAIAALAVTTVTLGGTFAWFVGNDSFANVFKTGKYSVPTTETFTPPPNWTPGTTTQKTVTTTNQGTVAAYVRVKTIPSWLGNNGQFLPNTITVDGKQQDVAILNYTNINDWVKHGEWYYYKKLLKPNQAVTFLNSVTFNPEASNLTTNYSESTLTLNVDAQTVQVYPEASDPYKAANDEWKVNLNEIIGNAQGSTTTPSTSTTTNK